MGDDPRWADPSLDDSAWLTVTLGKSLSEQGFEYKGTTKVKHLLWILVEDIGLDKIRPLVKRKQSLLIGAGIG